MIIKMKFKNIKRIKVYHLQTILKKANKKLRNKNKKKIILHISIQLKRIFFLHKIHRNLRILQI